MSVRPLYSDQRVSEPDGARAARQGQSSRPLRALEKFKHKGEPSSKIIDFHTGEPYLSDDEFMDQMLDKINKQGKESLTHNERARMQRISEKRSKK